ncbi:hypothetical protein K2173_015514 [Erythroxylum novogranatense]|uniref:25S rRNA (uridine-N(3))-methyltransferase BMT5-like domain-containing protein n=1 Tax=Erythroxylum novogranatense TaxID=1862640 RepID=A0AAV8SRS9_9ROSI|nr:hypothetical protein K2173_015514 [Erythroxylum novogranatense]
MHRRLRGTAVFVNGNVRGCHGEIWVKHYSSDHRILLVGEGDFSFSLSLAVSFGSGSNIVATSRDTLGALIKKYKKVESNLETLKYLGASVLHGVDATQMQRHESLRMHKFDRIVFNFPHAGFHGREDNPDMIERHRKLLRRFFSNAINMLEMDGEVHVTHKTAHPYCLWNIEELASSNSLSLIDSVDFLINDYPGYSNKRGDGANSDDPFPLGECRTFKFMMFRGSRPHIYSNFDCKTCQLLECRRDNMINYHNYGQLTPTVWARRETEGVSNVYKHAVSKYGREVNNPCGPIKQMQMQNWERHAQEARSSQQLKGDPVLLQHENALFNSRHPEQIVNIDRDKFLRYVPTPSIINFRSEDSIEPGRRFNHASKTRDGSFNFYLDEPLRCHRRIYKVKASDRTLNGYPYMSQSSRKRELVRLYGRRQ